MHASSVMHATEVMCMQNKVYESLIPLKERKLTVMDFSEWHCLSSVVEAWWLMDINKKQASVFSPDWRTAHKS